MAVPSVVDVDLDHLALAAHQAFYNFARYYGQLAGQPGVGGEVAPGHNLGTRLRLVRR